MLGWEGGKCRVSSRRRDIGNRASTLFALTPVKLDVISIDLRRTVELARDAMWRGGGERLPLQLMPQKPTRVETNMCCSIRGGKWRGECGYWGDLRTGDRSHQLTGLLYQAYQHMNLVLTFIFHFLYCIKVSLQYR